MNTIYGDSFQKKTEVDGDEGDLHLGAAHRLPSLCHHMVKISVDKKSAISTLNFIIDPGLYVASLHKWIEWGGATASGQPPQSECQAFYPLIKFSRHCFTPYFIAPFEAVEFRVITVQDEFL